MKGDLIWLVWERISNLPLYRLGLCLVLVAKKWAIPYQELASFSCNFLKLSFKANQQGCRRCMFKKAPFLPRCCLGSFTWTVFDSLSPQRCTRLHFGGPLNKNAMSTKWIERKSPLGAVSDIPPSLPCHGLRVKSSSSSHKLAGRFISSLTFSLEMPPGTWASALWREMTGLLLGAAVVKSYSHTPSGFFFCSLLFTRFLLLMKPFSMRWQPL